MDIKCTLVSRSKIGLIQCMYMNIIDKNFTYSSRVRKFANGLSSFGNFIRLFILSFIDSFGVAAVEEK